MMFQETNDDTINDSNDGVKQPTQFASINDSRLQRTMKIYLKGQKPKNAFNMINNSISQIAVGPTTTGFSQDENLMNKVSSIYQEDQGGNSQD